MDAAVWQEAGLLAEVRAFLPTGNAWCRRPLVAKAASFQSAPRPVPVTWEQEEAGQEEGPASGEVEPALGRSFLMAGEGPNAGVELNIKQLLHFCLLLGISLAALLGNGLIISAVACGQHLHTPMFFFLLNLALTDLGSICTTVPKAMHNSLWDTRTISYTGCAAQLFFSVFFNSVELSLLTIMCYDRFVSICK
ncbi:olfactory receptor 14I1-like, partial [Motacilla alba alba]|uniref:olfactory receptor 14I1-like n=1 Tax=Motacilla alba alba TaxID=1094192 RepID=UPI0018D58493